MMVSQTLNLSGQELKRLMAQSLSSQGNSRNNEQQDATTLYTNSKESNS